VISLDRFPGLSEHAFLMKTLVDTYRLRNHIIDCLELADVTTVAQTKKELLSFVVVGAGFSGVETVGEMAEMIDRALDYYPNIRREEVRIYLVEYSNRLLPDLPEDLAAYAAEKLANRGVEIRLGTAISSATGTSASFADGKLIETRTIVATIGTAPSPLIAALPVPKQWGRILVDRCLRVPDFKHVWALGDAALVPLTDDSEEAAAYAPPTARRSLIVNTAPPFT
jgi:NADH dehydrogenase